MYLSYEEYKELGGTKDETTFSNNQYQIESKIDYITSGRIKKLTDIPEPVKMLCLRLHLNFWEKIDVDKSDNLASYSNGIESFGYISQSSEGGASTLNKQINNIIREYLWEYPQLLYRGVR